METSRPCASTDTVSGVPCTHLVAAGVGVRTCSAGHVSYGIATRGHATVRSAGANPVGEVADLTERRGDTRRPDVVARWQTYDSETDRATWWVALRADDGTTTLRSRPGQKPVVALRYGAEPLSQRKVAWTHHARREMADDGIDADTVSDVLHHGVVWQQQHKRVVRMRGTDRWGRTIDVVYRINRRHEIVVITAMVVPES